MEKLTINYVEMLAQIVDQLGVEKPIVTFKKRKSGAFHATIEVGIVNWVSMGYRGPREFTSTSLVSARRAIRKAAHKAVASLDKYGLAKINDFSKKKLELWKERAMNIVKVCKEVVEERDVLERNYVYLKNKHGKLLVENARMQVQILKLEEQIACCMGGRKANKEYVVRKSHLDRYSTSMEESRKS